MSSLMMIHRCSGLSLAWTWGHPTLNQRQRYKKELSLSRVGGGLELYGSNNDCDFLIFCNNLFYVSGRSVKIIKLIWFYDYLTKL